ncbi:hypothetical protein NQZ68_022628 [Dissostichus eleginoides]|nr:hypothetical protein NQZ68_022628 [Dissostichus eleginoides]
MLTWSSFQVSLIAPRPRLSQPRPAAPGGSSGVPMLSVIIRRPFSVFWLQSTLFTTCPGLSCLSPSQGSSCLGTLGRDPAFHIQGQQTGANSWRYAEEPGGFHSR